MVLGSRTPRIGRIGRLSASVLDESTSAALRTLFASSGLLEMAASSKKS
jgi:hypothetical protein